MLLSPTTPIPKNIVAIIGGCDQRLCLVTRVFLCLVVMARRDPPEGRAPATGLATRRSRTEQ